MKSTVKTIDRMPLALSTAMLLACVWAASPALAEEAQKSQTVKFQDLDVNTREGVQTLYRRIHAAAWHVCLTTSTDPIYQEVARDCAKKAEAKAIETVNLPQLTALYRTKTGDRTKPLSANR